MKKLLATLCLLALCVGVSRSANNIQDMGAYKINASTKNLVDNSGNIKTSEASKDRDLDYYATVVTAAALDTAKDVCVAYSGVVDLRNYSSANLIVHVIPTADRKSVV